MNNATVKSANIALNDKKFSIECMQKNLNIVEFNTTVIKYVISNILFLKYSLIR